MNPETDLDDLDLKEEEAEEVVEVPEKIEKPDFVAQGKEMVLAIIGQNVFDRDLEQALYAVVEEHFNQVNASSYNSDIFRIPDLNMKIWGAFHNYEDFVHENKFENIDLNEIGKILREVVVPKITTGLWDLTTQQSQ